MMYAVPIKLVRLKPIYDMLEETVKGCWGSGRTDANGDATVTFPKPFSQVPKVLVQSRDASARGVVLDVYDVTTTGFKVKARKVTGLTTGSAGVHSHGYSGSTAGAGDHSHSMGMPTTVTVVIYDVDTCPSGHNNCVAVAERVVADSDHVHSISSAGGHTHGFSGTTGTAGAHTHSFDASPLEVDFDWAAVGIW
jgi:hypothetical protein